MKIFQDRNGEMPMNLLDAREFDAAKEVTTVIWEDACIRVEKIVSFGQVTPENNVYCQREAEWVSVLRGRGILYFPDTNMETILEAGDHTMILPGVRHRVIYTSKPCIWLCVFEKR